MSSKLREALDKIRTLCKTELEYCIDPSNVVDEILDIANSALAEPLKNCEVGTAEEQTERFIDFCDEYHRATGHNGCGVCPLWTSGTIGHHCELRWSQMPYEPVETKN